jgi:competence protein ComEC
MSVAAQIGTIPLTLHYFGQTSNYFALTNIVVIPAAFVLLLLGMSSLAFSWCMLGHWLAAAAQMGTRWLRLFVEWVEQLPFATTHITLSVPSVVLCYIAIACGLMLLRGNKVHWWWLVGVVACAVMIVVTETMQINIHCYENLFSS